MIKNPIVSVVMPVYNVEAYLREAIDSVINQTIGFEDNIELILVNDGSKDGSGEICQEYTRNYPHNIRFIEQRNQGVSAARRSGFRHSRAKYLHFMDSDDTISKDYYKETTTFFCEHVDDIDAVATKIIQFEARTEGHYLNYRFNKNRVIYVDKEPDAVHYHIASVLLKRSEIQEEWFDDKLSIGEDALMFASLLHKKRAYGVVSRPSYNYRVRMSGTSAINTQHLKRDYYTETPTRFWNAILELWRDQKGNIAPFAQNLIINDIQWRLNEQQKQTILTSQEESAYKKIVYETVAKIDDMVLLRQERLSLSKKISLLKRKYGTNFDKVLSYKKGKYFLNNYTLVDVSSECHFFALVFDFIHPMGEGKYRIEGYPVNDTLHSRDSFVIRTSKGEFKLTYVDRVQRRKNAFLGDAFHKQEAFEAVIEIGDDDLITAVLKPYANDDIIIPIFTKRFTKLGTLNHTYRRMANLLVKKKNHALLILPYSRRRHAIYELTFWLQVLKNIRLRDTYALAAETINVLKYNRTFLNYLSLIKPPLFLLRNIALNVQSIVLRCVYYLLPRPKRPIWIISDRGIGGGDNGEAFFKYMATISEPPVDCYFAISKRSPDYHRMKSIGKVVNTHSIWYKILFIRSDKIISSQADEYVINPFGLRQSHLVDLFTFDFIFLQHGVTKNDISDWLNRFFKNIKLFVTVSQKEHDSILEYPFYYSSNEVLLSGFPRYDQLINDAKNKVILAPTWRKYLTTGKIGKDGGWEYKDSFKESDYYTFFNNLLNDERIIASFKKAGVIGEFYLHPSHAAHIEDFHGNDQFIVKNYPYDYAKALREGSLMVTDYSSVYFDFSYLNKPVIYAQFDKEYYYENHGVYDRGYFDEERDGFGHVTKDYESTVAEIIAAINNNFKLEKKYQDRVDHFFSYHDTKNSDRVYQAILNLSDRKNVT